MEKKTKILGNRPISSARDRPEFGFSILEKGALHRHSNNHHNSGGSSKQHEGVKGRDGAMRKSSSFCGKPVSHGEGENGPELLRQAKPKNMRRPKTHPELLPRDRNHSDHPFVSEFRPVITTKLPRELATAFNGSKLLVNVTVLQSIGALRVLVSKDATVQDVIRAALDLYAKEGRRPVLGTDPASFGLHYSQFSMDGLNPTDRIKDLGSRNFFLCPKAPENARIGVVSAVAVPSAASCGKQTGQVSKITGTWFKVMDCLLLLP